MGRPFGLLPQELESTAIDRWEVAPSERIFIPPAIRLPGQMERIRGTEFGTVEAVMRDLRGGFEAEMGQTLGFRLTGVDLVDGVLYGAQAVKHLRPRERLMPAYLVPTEVTRGAMYESWVGNRWFGNWLSDDCLTYPLAAAYGDPVTSSLVRTGHVPDYEDRLGIEPRRIDRVHFEELILFRDTAHNASRRARADSFRARLIGGREPERHPGVFLLRGGTGAERILMNERAIAERLAAEHGFRVLDPSTAPLSKIVEACGGASIVAGVEGSHLVHGLMLMPRKATLMVVQPPERAVSVLKMITDRQGQRYAFVVATGDGVRFSAEWSEIVRTVDLILKEA
ncbi:MAG: glycosyltransferase family 61 protein [Amaricoccus sp.]